VVTCSLDMVHHLPVSGCSGVIPRTQGSKPSMQVSKRGVHLDESFTWCHRATGVPANKGSVSSSMQVSKCSA